MGCTNEIISPMTPEPQAQDTWHKQQGDWGHQRRDSEAEPLPAISETDSSARRITMRRWNSLIFKASSHISSVSCYLQ